MFAATLEDDSKNFSKSTFDDPSSLSVIDLITKNGILSRKQT